MNRIQKIKQHLKDNQTVYVVGTTCLMVGAAGATIVLNPKAVAHIRPVQILTWKSKQTVEVFVEALGDPGNIVQDLTTGTIYASQNQAAKALGVDKSVITRHLQGTLETVKGHNLVKLGKACVPQVGAEAIA